MLFKLIKKLNQEAFRENLEYVGAEKKAFKDGLYFAEKLLVDEYNESIVTDEPLYRIPISSIVAREALTVIRMRQKDNEDLTNQIIQSDEAYSLLKTKMNKYEEAMKLALTTLENNNLMNDDYRKIHSILDGKELKT